MAASWTGVTPALPTFFNTDGFTRAGRGNTLFTKSIDGRVKARRISTKSHEPITATMVMSLEQWDAFDDFYRTTLEDGSLPFQDLNNPLNGNANTVWQFTEDPTATPFSGSPGHLSVSMSLVALPDPPA